MKFLKILLCAILMLIFAGSLLNAANIENNKKDEEIRAIAEPILENIIAGLTSGDYAKYSRDFSARLKNSLSEEGFLEISQQIKTGIGDCLDREYLGYLSKGKMTLVFWKGLFDNSKNDTLIELKIIKENNKNRVAGLLFE